MQIPDLFSSVSSLNNSYKNLLILKDLPTLKRVPDRRWVAADFARDTCQTETKRV
jgi:hypothetical protein